MRFRSVVAALGATLTACRDKPADQPLAGTPASAVAAKISPGALRQMPWLLGTFRGGGADGTVQEPFYERYSLADDSTLVVESSTIPRSLAPLIPRGTSSDATA